MKNAFVILFVVFLSGCAVLDTRITEVDSNIFDVKILGGTFLYKQNDLIAKALVRAETKCGHENFKRIGEPVFGNHSVYNATVGYITSPTITIRVDCHQK